VCVCVCVCVCVALVIQHVMRMCHIVICSLPGSYYTFRIVSLTVGFLKKGYVE